MTKNVSTAKLELRTVITVKSSWAYEENLIIRMCCGNKFSEEIDSQLLPS